MIRFDGKVILVTGGATGIGLATATLARSLGARVAIAGRRSEAGRRAVETLGSDAFFIATDVSREEGVDRMMAAVESRFGRLDVLVNNAGIIHRAPVLEEDLAHWEEQMAINLRGVFLCCKRALPALIASKGAIVNLSSVLAYRTPGGMTPAYDATKAGVLALTRAIAARHGPDGVRANAVCPGYVPTDLNQDVWGAWTPQQRADIIKTFPLRRLGTPEDIASAILFLASDAASWISGVGLLVDGGRAAL
jgi:NAD(P)-dependent dehydrogenase (short-subunit alcohol dehydrogenase family)